MRPAVAMSTGLWAGMRRHAAFDGGWRELVFRRMRPAVAMSTGPWAGMRRHAAFDGGWRELVFRGLG